jgi:hypothetical protein
MRQIISKKNILINIVIFAVFVITLFIIRSNNINGAIEQGDNILIRHSPIPIEFKLLETSDLENIYIYDETRMNLYVYDQEGNELYVYDLPSISTINVVNISEESETITFYYHRLNTYLVMDFQGNIFLMQEYPADHIPDEINYTDSNDRLEINNHLLFYTIKIDDSTSFTRISFTTFIIFGVIVMFAGVEYIKLKTKES